jgi:signal transduction histidine kinase
VRVAPELPSFLADEEMLHQALVNVVMNAVQATASGGRVTVSASAGHDQVHIVVADTGRGIAPEILDAVFKPFFTTRHTGTGLGLPITREIVQRHGGSVSIESRVGIGTIVSIQLPLASTPAAEPLMEAAVA